MEDGAKRLTSLAFILQREILPSVAVATDRHLLGTLAKTARSRSAVLRVFTYPGEVLAAGRWHLAPAGAVERGEAFIRRLTGGRALALGEGYVGVSLLLPHRSALVSGEPTALSPVQVPNRYVRGLMRALKRLGLPAYYPGRDLVTVNRRPVAAVSFETDEEGRLVFEIVLAVERPLGAVVDLLDRWDRAGVIKADLLALEAGTCLREEIGESPTLADLGTLLSESFAEQFQVAIRDEPLSPLEQQAVTALAEREGTGWITSRAPRSDLDRVGTSGIQTGVLEAHFSVEQERFIKEIQLAGDFIANSPAIGALEYQLRLCPAERSAIGRVVDEVFGDARNYLLGVGPMRVVADTIVKGLPA